MADTNLNTHVSQEEMNKRLDELEGSDRTLFGWMAIVVLIIAVSMSLFHLYSAGVDMLPRMKLNAIHLAFALTLVFLIFPIKKKMGQKKVPWYDLLLAVLSASTGIYIIVVFAD